MILAEKASPYFLLKVPNILAILFYAEGCFIYAEVEIFQVKNKKPSHLNCTAQKIKTIPEIEAKNST